jgi:hypothetical protein
MVRDSEREHDFSIGEGMKCDLSYKIIGAPT